MRKALFLIFVLGLFFGVVNFASAHEEADLELFYSPTCPHCAKEKAFVEGLQIKYPTLSVHEHDVINNQSDRDLLGDYYQKYQVPESLQGLVPATFTSTKYFVGFDDKIAKEMESCLVECLHQDNKEFSLSHTSIIDKTLRIPFLGEIKLSSFSYPVMAAVLGVLDGFNVCSLGALILILSLVLTLKSRKKIVIYGGTFLLTAAVVYGFLIFFWYKLFELLAPYLKFMNILIGVLGLAGGIYFFRQFLKSRKETLVCDSEPGGKISSRFLPRIQKLLSSPSSLFLSLAAVLAFALVLTVVEFPCSAVVPIAFAAVMSQAGLPPFQYLLYIAIYILFYLLDELIVFLVAIFTSKIWLSSPKSFKWIVLLESVVLFSLGLYYLFSLA